MRSCLSFYVSEQLVCRFAKLVQCMKASKNSIVSYILSRALCNSVGNIGRNIVHIYMLYGVNIATDSLANLYSVMSDKMYSHVDLLNQGDVIQEMCDVRDGSAICDSLTADEANYIINELCLA